MVKKIPLTQGKYALVDDIDYEDLVRFNWFAKRSKRKKTEDVFYVYRHASKMEPTKFVYMHRHLLKPNRNEEIDHMNGNGLDNTRSNLRIVTLRQNRQNRHDEMTSNYPGVYWSKVGNKWTSQIGMGNRIKKNLGYFKSEKEAFNAYRDAVHELTGEKLVCEIEEGV